MLYQFKYSMKGSGITILSGENVSYQAHLHNSFEFVKVTDGKMTITVEKKSYNLECGDALLIFPNQVHEFKSAEYSANFILRTVDIIIPGKYICICTYMFLYK